MEFDHPGGGSPTVEVDLPAGLWSDVIGLGDAAVAGVAEAISQARGADEAGQGHAKLAADQLAGIRTIVSNVQGAIGAVRVRVYRDRDTVGENVDAGEISEYYTKKLAGSEWARIVHVRDGEKCASIFLMRRDGAIRGVFVVANEGKQLALVNVLCDLSPQRVKQITHEATRMGLELGGDDVLAEIVEELR